MYCKVNVILTVSNHGVFPIYEVNYLGCFVQRLICKRDENSKLLLMYRRYGKKGTLTLVPYQPLLQKKVYIPRRQHELTLEGRLDGNLLEEFTPQAREETTKRVFQMSQLNLVKLSLAVTLNLYYIV